MQRRVQYWAVATAGALAGLLGTAVGRPALLVGAAGAWAWLIAREVAFARTAGAVAADLSTTRSVTPERPRAAERASLETRASLPTPSAAGIAVTPSVPAGVETPDGDTVTVLVPGETDRSAESSIRFPVGGRIRFGPARATVGDGRLFHVTFLTGREQAFDVRPRPPGRILDADRGRRGLRLANPADRERVDLRRYTPSDPANRIDWNVTGRLGEAHVRTFESETARRTVIVLDHGAATARPVAAGGSSVLDHLRDAALGVVDRLDADDGAVGLVTVEDDGVTCVLDPGATSRDLSAVRDALVSTVPGDGEAATPHGDGSSDPATARRAAETLSTVDSAFAAGLRPFLSDVGTRAQQLADDALVRAIEREVPFDPGGTRYVLLTPGVDRVAVRTAVQRLRRDGDPVLVLLPPEEAFVGEGGTAGPYGRVDAATAGARRASARQFRRELGSTDGVTAATVEASFGGDHGPRSAGVAGRERRGRS